MIVIPNYQLPIIFEKHVKLNKQKNRCPKKYIESSQNLTLASGFWRRVKIGSGWAFEWFTRATSKISDCKKKKKSYKNTCIYQCSSVGHLERGISVLKQF